MKRILVSLVFTTFVILSLLVNLPAPAQAQFPIVNSAVVNYGNNTIAAVFALKKLRGKP
jgi:hypothetical protein